MGTNNSVAQYDKNSAAEIESKPVPTMAPSTQRAQGVRELYVFTLSPAMAATEVATIDPSSHANGICSKKRQNPPANPTTQLSTIDRFIGTIYS